MRLEGSMTVTDTQVAEGARIPRHWIRDDLNCAWHHPAKARHVIRMREQAARRTDETRRRAERVVAMISGEEEWPTRRERRCSGRMLLRTSTLRWARLGGGV